MTFQQTLFIALFVVVLGLLLWGRFRYDLVAASGLLVAVVLGLVPEDQAFSGFSNPAVIIVALVLVASRAFENSGALGVLARRLENDKRPISAHIAITGGLGALLSTVINNVAALALLMPMDVAAARKADRSPSTTLMPLAFATVLGGTVTLIGTPPNIIASAVRAQHLGHPYHMFDFTPVGLVVSVAGMLFIALLGWRLVPRRTDKAAALGGRASFEAELLVSEDSAIVGKFGAELDEAAEAADVLLVGLVRDGKRAGNARLTSIVPDDLLVVEGSTDAIAAFIKALDLHLKEQPDAAEGDKGSTATAPDTNTEKEEPRKPAASANITEAVVRWNSYLVGRSVGRLNLRARFGVRLLGVASSGTLARSKISDRLIAAGDVLLIAGRGASSPQTLESLGLIAVNNVSVAPFSAAKAALAIGLFAGAVLVASMGWLSFTVAIAIAVAAYAALGLVPAREFYTQIDWPVVVMLACLLPIGTAFDKVGGTGMVAHAILWVNQGHAAVIALVVTMVLTMLLSDVLNNVATMVIAGPIAIDVAQRLHVNPDTFLMGAAIATSCAFLTPIGHKNNTLIMGPGSLRFGDYWRMGLPLELVVLAVAVPTLLAVWPL